MSNYPTSDLVLDGQRIDFELLFVNLEGRRDQFNTNGDRTFRLKFNDSEFAQELAEEGWNIKIYTPKNTDYEPYHYMNVKAKFRADAETVRRDPEIHLINSKNDIRCTVDTMHDIDAAFQARTVKSVDLVLNPYHWVHPGMGAGEGVTAYLNQMWVVVEDSPFADRYANRNSDFYDEEIPF